MSFFRFLFSKTFLIQLVLAVIASILIIFLILQWLDVSTNQDQRIEVPSFAGMTLDQVDVRLEELELRREILDSANYDPQYPPYSVLEQAPMAGKQVKENRKIYLTLNPSGYNKVEIPRNLIRKSRRQVEPTLRSLGFEIGTISYKPDFAPDVVLELRHKGKLLEPGMSLMKTSTIDLVLGDGSQNFEMNEQSQDSLQQVEEGFVELPEPSEDDALDEF